MKGLFVAAVVTLAPALARAGTEIHVSLPDNATMAVIQQGVQVVVRWDEEIFHTNAHYWLRRGGNWYRARHHTDGFMLVEDREAPSTLTQLEPGRYRNFDPDQDPDRYADAC